MSLRKRLQRLQELQRVLPCPECGQAGDEGRFLKPGEGKHKYCSKCGRVTCIYVKLTWD